MIIQTSEIQMFQDCDTQSFSVDSISDFGFPNLEWITNRDKYPPDSNNAT